MVHGFLSCRSGFFIRLYTSEFRTATLPRERFCQYTTEKCQWILYPIGSLFNHVSMILLPAFRCLPKSRVGTATGLLRALVTVVSYSVVPQSSVLFGSSMSPTILIVFSSPSLSALNLSLPCWIWCSCGTVLLLLWEAFCLCLSVFDCFPWQIHKNLLGLSLLP